MALIKARLRATKTNSPTNNFEQLFSNARLLLPLHKLPSCFSAGQFLILDHTPIRYFLEWPLTERQLTDSFTQRLSSLILPAHRHLLST